MSITVRRDGITGTRHILKVRAHEIAVDTGGEHDAGPTPHDLYDSALAACKALTVLVYAQHKGIPVEEIEVAVNRDDSQERQGLYKLDTTLHVTGALSEEQKAALLR
ncbi:MAG TPA: OsmC family protein, partial [Variovorax sp.]|nr:OsmC family protein [Variovorax sp.]